MDEIHLIIIWNKALNKKEKIFNDLNSKFKILNQYLVSWSRSQFSENLSRFYGENLPKNSNKEKHCGIGSFCCIIVKDNNPIYNYRKTSKGNKIVNINLFDLKKKYRKWTGGGHKIHATDNIFESKLQLAILFGKSYTSFLENKLEKNTTELVNYKNDLQGSKGWDNFFQLFSILNECLDYVVLRNFNNIEKQLNSLHPDIDLLVNDKNLAARILNGKTTFSNKNRVQYLVKVCGKNINFDLRSISDNYYCEKWQRKILLGKRNFNGFFIPSKQDYFYSLLYHALIHKRSLSIDYTNQLIILSKDIGLNLSKKDLIESLPLKILINYLDIKNYEIVAPNDLSVYFNYGILTRSSNIELSLRRKRRIFYLKIRTRMRKILNKLKKSERYN
ncbi:MAG: hypothetical protein ACPGTO_03670 [Polaribacter sp.]